MPDRFEERRVESPNTGQRLRVGAVILGVALRDEPQLPRVGHEHLVPARLKEATDPGRMRPGLQHEPHRPVTTKPSTQRLGRRRHPSLVDHPAAEVQHADVGVAVAHVQAPCHRRLDHSILCHRADLRFVGLEPVLSTEDSEDMEYLADGGRLSHSNLHRCDAPSPFDPGYDPVTLESHLAQSGHLMSRLKLSMASWLRRGGAPSLSHRFPFYPRTSLPAPPA